MSAPLLRKTITDTEDTIGMVLQVPTIVSNRSQNLVQDTTTATEWKEAGLETRMIARSTQNIADKTRVTPTNIERSETNIG